MKTPTPKQLEAYYWTHIVGLDNCETADKMSVSEQRVGQLLKAFFKIRPKLMMDPKDVPNDENTIRVDDVESYDIKHKF